ncbi:MAG TPA: FtsW/RodA/SpoVE family cell cycle protein [Patescibacteria group bacterium]|nr:FtsW/RodA/SpoVE family cell cycle protein [Patescibacteria group bacterium]
MRSIFGFIGKDIGLVISILFLLALSIFVLNSISPSLFPQYFVFIVVSLIAFWFFSQVGFEVASLFSTHLYIFSIFLLVLTIIIGSVTRGTVRWIPIGFFSLQPAEIVRPFLLVFFANYLTSQKITTKRIFKALLFLALPTFLILIQPSLSVAILTLIGFFGVLISSNFNKKYILIGITATILLLPIFYNVMAPYQKQRITTFLSPSKDPLGAGYNSLQSTIAAGSGEFSGRGLGRGVQTQLAFLPEKQTDFIFAATGEELGFVGAALMLIATFVILFRLTKYMENSVNPAARAYISGFLLTYLVQVFIHSGMNMGMLPVTGLPFPLVSAGGSSLLATMIGLGIALGANRR